MASLTVTPSTAAPGATVNVSGSGFSPKVKFALTTVDSAGIEVGLTSNTNRPRPDGTFQVGINVPPREGPAKVRAYQSSALVAEASVLVQTPVVTPPPPNPGIVVGSIVELLNALADNRATDILVRNGTYRVSGAGKQAADSLWIGSRFRRTTPVTVRAESKGGVIFDGGGAGYFGGMTFVDGACQQTWDGFSFANGRPTETGVIVFGAYGLASPHHITLRNITMLPSIVAATAQNDHCLYFSSDSPHDIVVEDYTATPGAGIRSALQFYHGPGAYNLVVRRMHVTGTQNAMLFYEATVHDVLVEDSDITGASIAALNMARCGANVVFRNVRSVNSGGTYFPNGQPSGASFEGCVWG